MGGGVLRLCLFLKTVTSTKAFRFVKNDLFVQIISEKLELVAGTAFLRCVVAAVSFVEKQ